MPQKKYIVRLTAQEREICRETIRKLNGSSEKVRRAQMLVKADADEPAWTDQQIADAFSCRTKTVENVRQRCVLEGFEQALERKRREFPPVPKLLDGEQEAHIIALRLGPPPKGYANWFPVAPAGAAGRRVGDRRVDQPRNHPADAKKNGMTQRKIQYWVIPPQADAEFVAHMEQVLDLYQKPYDPDCPVVCMDEQPVQLVKETRPPMAATKNRPRRVDYEYERAGTAAVFLFSEPAGGLAAGDRPGPAYEGGLGAGGRRPVGRTLRRMPEDHLGVRPPQHAHQGSLLRSVRAGPGTGIGSSHRVLPHAETRELAEHRGERTEFDDAPMRARAPHRRPRDAARRSVGVVHRRQWHATRCRLADEGRRCAL